MGNASVSAAERVAAPWLAAIVLAAASPAAANIPAESFVRGKIDEFADLIQSNQADRFTTLRTRVRRAADFDGFAKQALAGQWATATAQQRQEFSDAMQGLLESHYMSKPAAVFAKDKIAITGATPSGAITTVAGVVKRKDVDITFLVKVAPDHDSWRVLDVTIDGLSLLEDYRSQFQAFLKKKTLAQLVTRLHEKADANMRSASSPDANP